MALKKSVVAPILKKPKLDADDLANYSLVSSLPFIFKLWEKVVAKRLSAYLDDNTLLPRRQSANRRFNSTEMALLCVLSDQTSAMESGKLTLLTFLDMSAAFDLEILLRRLDATFGIRNGAIMWIASYLSDRTEKVHVTGYTSPYVLLKYGVPQGSVLGSLLFIMYTGELKHIINSHGLLSSCYANDCQLSFFCNLGETESLATRMINCVDNVSNWMSSNRLNINPTKTEYLWAATSRRQNFIPRGPIILSRVDIISSHCVTLLGVYIDDDMSASTRINKVVSSGSFYLLQIKSIRRCLPGDAAKVLVNAFVVSRLDYCNSLYANLPQA